MAHVTAAPTGVSFLPQPEQQVFYDEAAGCMHLVEGRMITAVALPPLYASAATAAAHGRAPSPDPSPAGAAGGGGYDSDSSVASATARAFLVSEGPPVRLIRSSLDGGFTALHRSARLVELHCHLTGCMCVETAGADRAGRKGGDVQLLGFFWTASHFVMVTAAGLEQHSVHPSLQALRLDSTLPLQGVQWYVYSPQTQMVVLGFGSGGAKLQAVQFSRAGTLRLPLLDLTPPWGSPIRPAVAAAVSAALDGFSAARQQPQALVGPDTCWVVVLYGRVFCAHHDRRAAVLRLYRMFRDATSLAHQYDCYAQRLELSVVDNVLLVHHIDSAVVMLVDILAPGAAPISSPLPLAVPLAHDEELAGAADLLPPGSPRGRSAEAGSSGRNAPAAAAQAHQAQGAPELPVSTGSSQPEEPEGAGAAVLAGGPAAGGYALHYPAWLVDGAAGLVYRLQLDLQAIAACQSDACALLAFLQRRRPCAAPRRDAVGISLRVLSGLAQEEAPLGLLRQAFEVVNSVHGAAQQAQRHQQHTPPRSAGSSRPSSAATDRSGAGSGRASPLPQGAGADAASAGSLSPQRQLPAAPQQPRSVVEPQDVHNSVFALLRAQQRLALSYQQAALAEYLASCRAHGLAAPPSLAALYVDLLLDQGLPHLVAPLLLSHPQLDSAVLAEHVEEAAAAGRLPGGAQLADQLLLRLGAHKARCALLLRTGRTAQALRLAKQHRLLGQLAPAALLDASASTGDALLFAAAHRLCAAQAQRAGGALQGLAEAAEAHHQRFQPAQFQALKAAAG